MATQYMMIDFDESEMAVIQAAAIAAGLMTHEYARRMLLGRMAPTPRVETPAVAPNDMETKPVSANIEVKGATG